MGAKTISVQHTAVRHKESFDFVCRQRLHARTRARRARGALAVHAEVLTNEGRIDMTCETPADIWLIEFKLGGVGVTM